MTVEAHQLTAAGFAHTFDGAGRITVAEIEAELRVVLTGGDVFVRVRLHTRGHANLHTRNRKTAPTQLGESIDLVETVDHDMAHT